MKRYGASLDLIFDTHALVWLGEGNPKLSRRVADILIEPETTSFTSAVIAWEYSDLYRGGRLPGSLPFEMIEQEFGLILLDFPATAWRHTHALPHYHGDPVDRMLIAHAIEADLTVVTADATLRRYPVKTLW